MPANDRTGPVGLGRRDGRGKKLGGRGQTLKGKVQGKGAKTGGQKGNC